MYSKTTTIRSDLVQLRPTFTKMNSLRGNYPFGDQQDANRSGRTVFTPRDAIKGEVARVMFYMATKYAFIKPKKKHLKLVEEPDETSGSFDMGVLSTLLLWHETYPVSENEVRLNTMYCKIQNNRNVFVDYPKLARRIWGTAVEEESDSSNQSDNSQERAWLSSRSEQSYRSKEPATLLTSSEQSEISQETNRSFSSSDHSAIKEEKISRLSNPVSFTSLASSTYGN